MGKFMVVVAVLASSATACVGSGDSCIASGTEIAIDRTNGSGTCPSDVVAGVMLLQQTFKLGKGAACGMDHYSINTTFTEQSGSGSMCQGSDAISIPDLGSDGGAGTDTMAITCASGVSCTETFEVTLTPQ